MPNTDRGPDPRPSVATDLGIYFAMVKERIGAGIVADTIYAAERFLQQEKIQEAQIACLKSFFMVQGATNLAEQSHREVTPNLTDERLQEVMAPWKQLEERARLTVHALDRLPALLRDWLRE